MQGGGGLARTPERVFVYCSTCPIMFAASVVNSFIEWELGLGEVMSDAAE